MSSEIVEQLKAAGIPVDDEVVGSLSRKVKAAPRAPLYKGGVAEKKLAPGVKKKDAVAVADAQAIYDDLEFDPLREMVEYYLENKGVLKPAEVQKFLDKLVGLVHANVKPQDTATKEDANIQVNLTQFNFHGSSKKDAEDLALAGKTIDIEEAAEIGKPGALPDSAQAQH